MNIYQYKCHLHIRVNVCGPHLYTICLMYPLLTYLYIILFGYIVYILVHLFDVPTTSLLVYLFKVPIVYLLVHLFEVPLRHDDLSSTALHGLSNEHTHFVSLLLNFIDGVLDLVCVLLTDLLRGVLITAVFTSVGVRTGHL